MLGVFTNLVPLEVRGARSGIFTERALAQQRQLAADLDHRAFSGVDVQRLIAARAGDPLAGLLPVVFTSVLGEAQAVLPDDVEVLHGITQTPQTWLDNKVYEIGQTTLAIDWDAPLGAVPRRAAEACSSAYVTLIETLARREAAWDEHRPVAAAARATRAVRRGQCHRRPARRVPAARPGAGGGARRVPAPWPSPPTGAAIVSRPCRPRLNASP